MKWMAIERKIFFFPFLFFLFLHLGATNGAVFLPLSRVFVGKEKFEELIEVAQKKDWPSLPLGERIVQVGLFLVGTPYRHYTLEIDDQVESPSVNFYAMDCWTFYETSLAFARMLHFDAKLWTPQTLLRLIEIERYRNGECTGSYLSRIHFLEELFDDNQKRGLVVDKTKTLHGVPIYREVKEMTEGWRQYRYLRHNPSLLPAMALIEQRVSRLPVYHIPKNHIRSIESKISNGDIIAITTLDPHSYTSHVGIAYKDREGILRFLHASSTHHQVYIDKRLSDYVLSIPNDAGIIVVEPKEVPLGLLYPSSSRK
ncbi:N-acetylmuramoyl-L-alanine amidase-like domain-containing protein [Candidatus Methylacidiphilum infernorum]|nr:N-acetylmuramoyl-L-alanine amidase-like domain-containing protein [Candidatus Methylacidiphilum infernorum]